MKRAILSCNGMDKPEGSVAREVAIRFAAATGSEIICPVLLNRAPARYKKSLTESALIVVDGCSTRCASRLAAGLEARVERKDLVTDAVKALGRPLESSLSLGPESIALAQSIADDLLRNLNAPEATREPDTSFEPPTEYLIVAHDKFEFRIPAVDYFFNENDVWVRVLDGVARIGISDYMQQSLTDINFFDPPKAEDAVEQFGELGSVESAKAVFEIVAPASGTVTAVNPAVIANPGLINEDPYGSGWLVELKLTHWSDDLGLLHDGATYAEIVKRKAEEA
ncbi:MAG TPA: putative zinc-binding protein [Terracidiphilus sp.]|nr:putative zinc-binding protein [Terracidiphilus sp.]HEV2397984.1 putative zinc-binding protein [Candidatus Sulfotelmatobacter sp.]